MHRQDKYSQILQHRSSGDCQILQSTAHSINHTKWGIILTATSGVALTLLPDIWVMCVGPLNANLAVEHKLQLKVAKKIRLKPLVTDLLKQL